METGTPFKAPWGRMLKLITGISAVVLLALPLAGAASAQGSIVRLLLAGVMPLLILAIAALFTIRGYVLTPDALFIKRLLWSSRLDLAGLKTIEADPAAMRGSVRTWGNGGLFSFSGRFRNKRLGSYRAFVTNPALAVVLRFDDHLVIVTPGDPAELVARVRSMRSI